MASNTTYKVRTDRHTDNEIQNVIDPDLGAIICSVDTGTYYLGTEIGWSPISTLDVSGLLDIQSDLESIASINIIPTVHTLNGQLYQEIEHNKNRVVNLTFFDLTGSLFVAPYRNINSNTVCIHSEAPLIGTVKIQ